MKLASVTFLVPIPSPKDNNSVVTFGDDEKSYNGGYDLELRENVVFVTWRATGRTEVAPWAGVRSARLPLPEAKGAKVRAITGGPVT